MHLFQSKYFRQTIQILSEYSRRGQLKNIEKYANDEITRSKYTEILSLMKNNDIANWNMPRESPKKSRDGLDLCDDVECNE